MLRRRELQLQHPHGPGEKGHGPVRRQHGHRHAPGRREAVSRIAAAATSVRDISGCWTSATACRSSRCTTRPISIAAASACSTSVRCSGATAGPWRARTSRRARIRLNPRARARRSRWPCRACRWAGRRGRGGGRPAAGGGRGAGAATAAGADPDPGAGAVAGVANWPAGAGRRAHVAVHDAGAAEMDGHAGRQRRRLSGVAVLQDHRRGHRSRARGDGRRASSWSCPRSPADQNNCGASTSSTDGTYRVMPKAMPDSKEPLALSAVGSSKPTLARFRPRQRSAALAVQDAMSPHRDPRCSLTIACACHRSRADAAARGPRRRSRSPATPAKAPDADGFLQRWLILEPIRMTGQLTDSAVQTLVKTPHFPGSAHAMPARR